MGSHAEKPAKGYGHVVDEHGEPVADAVRGRGRGRQPRRAQRPATDGVPEIDRAERSRELGAEEGPDETTDREAGSDRTTTWWREQRPPHWQ